MRVLWVCNIMLPVIAEHLGRETCNKEGWLSGLCSVILLRQKENRIDLHVAFPVEKEMDGYMEEIVTRAGTVHCYGFYEDVNHAEDYDAKLEERLGSIMNHVQADVVHCFGTEYAHTLAVIRSAPYPERVLVGIQGVCGVIAEAYMANLPESVQQSRTFRDILKRDSMREQQQKFMLRGQREKEILRCAVNVTGRTDFDRNYVVEQNPGVHYFLMNETLRPCFYEARWKEEMSEPYSIFISQGDYPLKGLHYMLLAAAKLRKQYPDLQIYVAGNSVVNHRTILEKIKISAYGKYLLSIIRENGLEDCVHFTGRLSVLEMKARYLRSSLFVCCSANENSPNSLGEAMILGMPCVAANVGGVSSLFTDGEDGILYDGYNNVCDLKKDAANNTWYSEEEKSLSLEKAAENTELDRNVENLCKAVIEIWENPERTREFCKNARIHAKKTHSREDNYRKMMEIYATVTLR